MHAFFHVFRRGNSKKILIVRPKCTEFSALEIYIEVGKALLFLIAAERAGLKRASVAAA
jgi:hypothetical protein